MNADGQFNPDTGLAGNNLFAYCNNDPINASDYNGARFTESDDGSGRWVNYINNRMYSGTGRPITGGAKSSPNNVGTITTSIGTGIADAVAGNAIQKSLKRTTVVARQGPGVGVATLSVKNAGKVAKALRGVSEKIGVATLAFYALDVYSDFQNYIGWDLAGAITIDTIGAGLGVLAGIGIASLCVPLAATVLAVSAGVLIGIGTNYAKDVWLKKK